MKNTIELLNKMSLEYALQGLKSSAEATIKTLMNNDWETDYIKHLENYHNYLCLVNQMINSEIYKDLINAVEYIPVRLVKGNSKTVNYIEVTWKE